MVDLCMVRAPLEQKRKRNGIGRNKASHVLRRMDDRSEVLVLHALKSETLSPAGQREAQLAA